MESPIKYAKAMSAIEIVNKWMFELDKSGIDPSIAYAAFGLGLATISKAMGFDKERVIRNFTEILEMHYNKKRQREEGPPA